MDLKLANMISLETSRWLIVQIVSIGVKQEPLVCIDLEGTVKRLGGRRQKN
jgi:hypothetical protein